MTAPVMGLFGGVAVVCALAMGREVKIGRPKGNLLGYKAEMQRWGRWMRFWISVHLKRRDPEAEKWNLGVEEGILTGNVALPHGLVMRSGLTLKGNVCISRRILGR